MVQPPLHTAKEVSEYLLKVTADALMSRDFDSFAAVFHLPQKISTASSEIIVASREELLQAFNNMCDHFQSSGVTQLDRSCVAADFYGDARVEATHVSRVIRDGQDLIPPYPVFSVLERIDGMWKITASDYALDDTCPQAQALLTSNASDPAAEAIYQEHLDELSNALITNDFARFARRIQLPHRITTQTESFEITDEQTMRETFDGFAIIYADRELTALVRIVLSARFVTKDEIIGIHKSHQMRGASRVVQPYPNRVRLARGKDGKWRETHCANAILNTSENFRLWTRVADTPRLPDLDLSS